MKNKSALAIAAVFAVVSTLGLGAIASAGSTPTYHISSISGQVPNSFILDASVSGQSEAKFYVSNSVSTTYLGADKTPADGLTHTYNLSSGAYELQVRYPTTRSYANVTVGESTTPTTPSVTPTPTDTSTANPNDIPKNAAGEYVVSNLVQMEYIFRYAQPGDVINITDGDYVNRNRTVLSANGTEQNPIIVKGNRAARILSRSPTGNYGLWILGDHVTIQGITVGNSSKGIVLDGSVGSVIDGVEVFNVGDEGIHFRSSSSNGVVRNSFIHDTGLSSPNYGEGLYVGSANSNYSASQVHPYTGEVIYYGSNNGTDPDESENFLAENNVIEDTTAEGADLKEGTDSGTLRNNVFINSGTSGKNSADSAIDVKGNNWQIVGNTIRLTKSTWKDKSGVEQPIVYSDAIQTHRVYQQYGSNNNFLGNKFEGSLPNGYLVRITPEQTTKPTFGNKVACDQDAGGASAVTNVACVL